jgi:hypothetical protein
LSVSSAPQATSAFFADTDGWHRFRTAALLVTAFTNAGTQVDTSRFDEPRAKRPTFCSRQNIQHKNAVRKPLSFLSILGSTGGGSGAILHATAAGDL